MILFAGGVGIGIGAGFHGMVVFTVALATVMARIGNCLEKRKFARAADANDERPVDMSN
ncbi:hypothetical protein PACILC2_30450 [Paenibacillus cisolokensis]|uniref:Uncharacterized protein n=1 Tax=Paenibacillus cisolokensis TaxID=1658519 RepID=A0ABQ4N8G1_9BACL|nr:hypothetical protein [Paenibacillus cisolokensis]GIQ64477.1 hypothetical protein PACILC2_30450 [Paenibacillus cisolokensis]